MASHLPPLSPSSPPPLFSSMKNMTNSFSNKMGIKLKIFMISFMFTSIFLSILYFITKLTIPITSLNPMMLSFNMIQSSNKSYPVSFAYLISASKGDSIKLKRTLRALYHPGNHYLLHLDRDAPPKEQKDIAEFVANDPVFSFVGNVYIVKKPNLVTYRGPTMLATTLHALAMLLRCCKWDWFINLSASDYPLVTQDDLIDAFSGLPRDVNFIQHTSHLGWKFNKRGKPIVIDPGLYSKNKSEIWFAIKQRALPTSFNLYSGSAWTVLSRSFSEYSIIGWDNLPRTLLMYFSNIVSTPEFYFQTLICNSEYKNTTINSDLHYISWDNPPKQHPRNLGPKDFRRMILSSRPFARKFKKNNAVLDQIDRELLNRSSRGFSYGGWCSKNGKKQKGCLLLEGENYGELRPGAGSRRLKSLLDKILSPKSLSKRQCRL